MTRPAPSAAKSNRRPSPTLARKLIVRIRTVAVRKRAMAAAEFDLCIIVDDDEDILVAARLALRGLFRELITVSSPERAIAATAGRQPDVILLDANFARGATDAREGLALLDRLLTNDPEAIVV